MTRNKKIKLNVDSKIVTSEVPNIIDQEVKPERYVVGFTGIEKNKKLTNLLGKLEKLGLTIVNDIEEFDKVNIIVMNELYRTPKLMIGFNNKAAILSIKWANNCIKQNQILDIKKSDWISNKKQEKLMGIDMKELVNEYDNLSIRKHKILQGKIFWVEDKILPSYKEVVKIIETGGGQIIDKDNGASEVIYISEKQYLSTYEFTFNHKFYDKELIFSSVIKRKFCIQNIDKFLIFKKNLCDIL